ncbi:MAG: PorP/SprF family type IX secretion system membrane protein [Bacteroidota bacterium]
MKQFCLSIIAIFALIISVTAQDSHFTQFYATPMNLNPALAGGFDGTYRFSFLYRDQWAQAMESPFATFNAALDLRFPIRYNQSRTQDAFGAGIMFETDRVSSVGYSSTGAHFFAAFHKSLSSRNNQYLSGGVQFGLNQRNINNTRLTFEDQFNGSTGFTGATNELLPPENSFAFSDLSVGLNYSYSPSRSAALFLGGAIHHVLEPEISYYYDRQDDDDALGSNALHRKYTAHIGARFPLTSKVSLLPRAVARLQGPHLEVNAGSNVRFALGQYGGSAMHIGGWVRPVGNEQKALDLEAAIMMVGFEVDNVLFGFSYDLSLSALQANRSQQSAFEISIAYLGNYNSETILCPTF